MRIDPRTNLPFDQIYKNGGWDKKGSGPGSTEEFTRDYRNTLACVMRSNGIRSVVDLACGDWQFSRFIDWRGLVYTGIDIVPEVIQHNKDTYGSFAVRFKCADISTGYWPQADLLIVKDVLHHLEPADAEAVVENSKRYRWVLWTVDVSQPGDVENVPAAVNEYLKPIPIIYEFDLGVDDYRYGRKVTKLAFNSEIE